MKIEIKKGKDLTKRELTFLSKETRKNFGDEEEVEDVLARLKKERNSSFFLLKKNQKILSFGFLRPEKIKYLNKNYNIFGIRNIISVEKKKGHGSLLMKEVVKFLKEKEKTGIGFTGSRVAKFYQKVGFLAKKEFRKRFFKNYKGVATWGFYVEGKDNFITKILKTKARIEMPSKKW